MLRIEKVTEAIRQEASIIIHDELKDPRLGFVTITRVEMTPNLRFARIFFSVLGQDRDYTKTKEALDSALGFIRSLIAQRIRLRFAPEIAFYEDHSSEYSIKIEEVLNEIKKNEATKDLKVKKTRAKLRKESKVEPKKRRSSRKKV